MCAELGGELMRRRLMMAMGMEEDEVKEWKQVASVDLSQFASAGTEIIKCSIQASEILIVWEDVENGTATASSVPTNLNGARYDIPACKSGKSGNPISGYTRIKLLKGIGTLFEISAGAISKTNYSYVAGLNVPYNLLPIIDEFTEIDIYQPPTQYFAINGTLHVYAR